MSETPKTDKSFDLAGLMESAFLMGLGALEVTRERTSDLTEDLIERGRMSKSEAKQVADRIGEAAEKQQEVVRSAVSREIDRAMKAAGVATHEDLAKLQSEISEIKAMIAKIAGSTD